MNVATSCSEKAAAVAAWLVPPACSPPATAKAGTGVIIPLGRDSWAWLGLKACPKAEKCYQNLRSSAVIAFSNLTGLCRLCHVCRAAVVREAMTSEHGPAGPSCASLHLAPASPCEEYRSHFRIEGTLHNYIVPCSLHH